MTTTKTSKITEQAQYHADGVNNILEKWSSSAIQIFIGNDQTVDLLLPDGSLLREGVCGKCEKRILEKLEKAIEKDNSNR